MDSLHITYTPTQEEKDYINSLLEKNQETFGLMLPVWQGTFEDGASAHLVLVNNDFLEVYINDENDCELGFSDPFYSLYGDLEFEPDDKGYVVHII